MSRTGKVSKTRTSLLAFWVASVLAAFLLGWITRGEPDESPNATQERSQYKDGVPTAQEKPLRGAPDTKHNARIIPGGSVSGRVKRSRPTVDPANLFKTRDPLARLSVFIEVLQDLGPHNIQLVRTAFETLPSGTARNQEMQLFFHAWAKFAPEDAIRYAQTLEKSETHYATRTALASWAGYNAPSAMKWIDKHPDANRRGEYQVGIIQGVATFDPARATDLLYDMTTTNYRFQAASILVKYYVEEDMETAMAWARNLPGGDQQIKETILSQVASEVAQKAPERCAEWALTMEEGEGRKRVISAVINYWSRSSHKDTATWVKKLPEGPNKYYAIEQMVNQWAWRNPVDTAKWLNQFPPSEKLDPAIDNFARRIMHKEPAKAANWAHSLVNEKRRNKSLGEVLKNWKKQNPDEAETWTRANALDLAEEEAGN